MLLILVASINFTHILDFMVMMPLGNHIIPYFKITTQEFSVIVASYSLSAWVSGVVAAFFVDNYDRKKVLLFGYIGFVIGTLCCGIAPTFTLLVISRITAGLFGGLIGAQVLSIVADSFVYEKRGQAMGIVFAAFSLASIVGVPFALFLADNISWHAPFILIAAMGAVIVPFVMRYMPSMTGHLNVTKLNRVKPLALLKNMFSNQQQVLALLLTGCLMLGHFVIIPFINPYLEHNVGFTERQRMLVYVIGGIASLLAAPVIGRLADTYGKHRIFTIFALLSLIPIFLITNMPAIEYFYVLMVTGVWFALSTGRGIPAQALVSGVVQPEQRGSFMSFIGSFQQMFTGLASLISGFIVYQTPDHKIHNYPYTGYFSIAVVLLCILICSKIKTPKGEKSAAVEGLEVG